jgi:hypothetical protein
MISKKKAVKRYPKKSSKMKRKKEQAISTAQNKAQVLSHAQHACAWGGGVGVGGWCVSDMPPGPNRKEREERGEERGGYCERAHDPAHPAQTPRDAPYTFPEP